MTSPPPAGIRESAARDQRPAQPDTALNAGARRVMERLTGEPFWLCDWRGVVFLHYEVDAAMLQCEVPFPLDLRQGRAYVSLVAFTLRDLRPRLGGRLAHFLIRPFDTHRFLNVRTYVRHQGVAGIYFLAEWLDAPRLNLVTGPWLYGLPFRCGRIDYHNDDHNLAVSGRVRAGGCSFGYNGRIAGPRAPAAPGSPEEFLVERYLAFTHRKGRDGWFPVWHPPWRIAPLDAKVTANGLPDSIGEWWRMAAFHSAHWSSSAGGVWMGWRRRRIGLGLTARREGDSSQRIEARPEVGPHLDAAACMR